MLTEVEVHMPEHPNTTIVRRAYEAFSTGDIRIMSELLAADAVWHAAGRNWIVGDYYGREAIMCLFMAMGVFAEGTYRVEVHDVVANDEHAIGLHRSTASRPSDGRTMDVNDVLIFHIRDGKIVEVWATPWDQYEEDQFYGPEPPAGMAPPPHGRES
jgi:ketosteroid isomerase-like protein